MRVRAVVLGTTLLTLVFAGCFGATPEGGSGDASFPWSPCLHPWPCADGSEWPAGLEGPFAIRDAEVVWVDVADGVVLHGAVWMPDVPADTKVPVVLTVAPYFGECIVLFGLHCVYPAPDDRAIFDFFDGMDMAYRELVEAGYAVAFFNVRGTGLSSGCFEFYGPGEQADMPYLVHWLADQSWSNGRVGMYGLSYFGTTPWQAAVQAPEPLKTIVPMGWMADLYSFEFTPQGAPSLWDSVVWPQFAGGLGLAPPLGQTVPGLVSHYVPLAADRVCREVVQAMTEATTSAHTGLRDERFWSDRNLLQHYGEVTAAVFMAHSSQEWLVFQVDEAWRALAEDAPKRLLLGTWGHVDGYDDFLLAHPDGQTWAQMLVAWLDFWLKGIGEPPQLGVVDHQDRTRAWHRTTAWPPPEARDEALYLNPAETLEGDPGSGSFAFRALPTITPRLCPGDEPRTSVLLVTPPVKERTHIAGNPFAHLVIESDLPGGIVAVDLVDVHPEHACATGVQHLRFINGGAADLRFHDGNFQAQAFPVGEATPVRVDIGATSWMLEPGHRLGLLVSGDVGELRRTGPSGTSGLVDGTLSTRYGQPYHPTILVHAESHVVVPIVSATVGGTTPVLEYPARPFAPAN